MTLITETNDFDLVKQDPAAWYHLPRAVLDDANLTMAERHALLDEWALDIADRSAATDEGMAPDKPSLTDHDIRMQTLVAEAQAALAGRGDAAEPLSLAARIWRRITGSGQPAALANVTE